MALSKKDTYNLLKELSEYGTAIYYLLNKENENQDKKALTLEEIKNLIYKENMEQVALVFPKVMGKIGLDDLELANKIYQKEYSKKHCIESLIEKYQDKYVHLRNIKEIALTEELADEMIQDATYYEALNLHYTDKIISLLERNPKDQFFSTKETLANYRSQLESLKKENEQKLGSNINNYYISTITE